MFLMPFTTQIAGHGSTADGHKVFLQHQNGRLLKPFQKPPKGTREQAFYESVALNSDDPIDLELRPLIPKYYGIETVPSPDPGVEAADDYFLLEDATLGLERPNIMDVKIGSRTWGPDASAEKAAHEAAKYPGTKAPLGFSVLGIIVHPMGDDTQEMVRHDRSFGTQLKTEDVIDAPKMFFDYQRVGVIPELVEVVLARMRTVLDVMARQRKYLIYGSSLLFAFDTKIVGEFREGKVGKEALEKAVNVKMIDFAHVWPSGGVQDTNFVNGLTNLIKVFEDYKKLS